MILTANLSIYLDLDSKNDQNHMNEFHCFAIFFFQNSQYFNYIVYKQLIYFLFIFFHPFQIRKIRTLLINNNKQKSSSQNYLKKCFFTIIWILHIDQFITGIQKTCIYGMVHTVRSYIVQYVWLDYIQYRMYSTMVKSYMMNTYSMCDR